MEAPKLIKLKIKPCNLFRKDVYGYADTELVRSLFGQYVYGFRDGLNYYNVNGNHIHIYNATEIE